MVSPSESSIVLVKFPFSDLSSSKLRPAVVLASAGRDDWIPCQVTSNPYADLSTVQITNDDFNTGSLQKLSYATFHCQQHLNT
jgi:mRNA interferase MazF